MPSYKPRLETLETRNLLAGNCGIDCAIQSSEPPLVTGDVNLDGVISPIDALLIINALNSLRPSVPDGEHLFILSGQSNIQLLNYRDSFLPTLKAEYEDDSVLIIKEAQGGRPIRDWYKDWDGVSQTEYNPGVIYDRLLSKLSLHEMESYATITFVWVQGESDARQGFGNVYKDSLIGLVNQLQDDLNRNDINVVLGRLSDFDEYIDWQTIRSAQEAIASEHFWATYVNTDDLNDFEDSPNDLHYTDEGYVEFGKRLANAAIDLNIIRHIEEKDATITADLRPIEEFWLDKNPDTNHDGFITPLDALMIINTL